MTARNAATRGAASIGGNMAVTRVTLFKAFPGKAEALNKQLEVNVVEVRAAIENMIDIKTGPKTGGNAEYDCAIVATYPDQQALDDYDVHPAHLSTRERMNGFVAERLMFVFESAG